MGGWGPTRSEATRRKKEGGPCGRERRSATWGDTTWTWWLRDAPIVADGARREQGKAARARRGMDATDRRSRDSSGARCQRRGVGGREKSGAARRRGADMQARPAQCRAARFKLGLKPVQMKFEFL
jgi:hypothetical protein